MEVYTCYSFHNRAQEKSFHYYCSYSGLVNEGMRGDYEVWTQHWFLFHSYTLVDWLVPPVACFISHLAILALSLFFRQSPENWLRSYWSETISICRTFQMLHILWSKLMVLFSSPHWFSMEFRSGDCFSFKDWGTGIAKAKPWLCGQWTIFVLILIYHGSLSCLIS